VNGLGRSLFGHFFWKEMFGLEWCSYEFGYPSRWETLDDYSGYQKSGAPYEFDDVRYLENQELDFHYPP